MAIVINGSGTVTGLAVGGLPDGTVDADTVAADVATQAELDAASVGGANGVDFNDNVKARFGTNNDLSIYHDHANSQNVQLSTSIPITFAANDLKFANGLNDTLLMKIDNDGHITAPKQPAFLAQPASIQTNIALNTDVTIVLGTERFDQNADIASNTFTAPVTGRYQFNASVRVDQIDSAASFFQLKLVTSNRTFTSTFDSFTEADIDYFTFTTSDLLDMDASDTAYITFRQQSGTQQADIDAETRFSGYLVC